MNDAQFPASSQRYQQDDEIDLRELFSAIWAGKWLIAAVTTVFAVAAVVIALYLPNIYKSDVLLAPASNQEKSGLAGLASQFGGLASLAGINLGGGSTDQTTLALQVLKSREFIGQFITEHHILVPLMAAKDWDRGTGHLIIDPELYSEKSQQWVRKASAPYKPEPSLQEAYKKFTKHVLGVSQDKESGMVTISVSFYSPDMAQQWVTWLVKDLNNVMRQRDMAEAQKSIQYLDAQISKTNLADMRSMLYQLVEQQTKTLMFAKVRDEYAFKTVDPAIVPLEKNKPKRALIAVLGTLLGGMLGVMWVLIRHFSRKED
ncbi:Wzz/FepE/Etk N-terminal domain-containing protein [Gallaecimonas sp. GXIMD1310]|uniref:Wzz/FepE/Etk N-terminal domain-containing protein n=1 Tax=Gallaecimonas sp. GXIMD1310 TaxID=3131926 RepID=UPI003244BD82